MATKYQTKKEQRIRRHYRVRKKVSGCPECPRLCVSFSNKHMFAQVIDDVQGVTMLSTSSQGADAVGQNVRPNVQGAGILGKILGAKMVEAGIQRCVFDRGGYRYHGKVKALADAVREAGMKF